VRVREQVELAGTGAEVPLELRLHGAHPVTALTEAADETDASMIVTGTRGRGGFHGLVIGKVPLRLLHHATRPVAVVPHR
jgi:nucleotide-binding universal stress UspA family protein